MVNVFFHPGFLYVRYGIINIMAINHMHDIIMMRINQRPNAHAR